MPRSDVTIASASSVDSQTNDEVTHGTKNKKPQQITPLVIGDIIVHRKSVYIVSLKSINQRIIMSNQIAFAPIVINVEGKTKAERQISVVRSASSSALTACLNVNGKVGKAIRENAAQSGFVEIAQHCMNSNYKPLAEMLAINLGEPVVISNRASFQSLPDLLESKIMVAKLAKSGGYRLDKKTGSLVSNAKLSSLMQMKAVVTEIIDAVQRAHEARKSQQNAIEA